MAGVVVEPTQPGPPQRLPSLIARLMIAVSSVTVVISIILCGKMSRLVFFLPPSPLAPSFFTFRKILYPFASLNGVMPWR